MESLEMEDVGIFLGHLVYFTVIWYILWKLVCLLVIGCIYWLFGIFVGYLVYVMVIWYIFVWFINKNLATLVVWRPDISLNDTAPYT
jgi:hypothetical protein